MNEKLNEYLEKYFIQILEINEFKVISSDLYKLGESNIYSNNHLKFKLINDRGIIETSISSIFSDLYFDFELLYSYYLIKTKAGNDKPKFGDKIINRRLSLEDISLFFEKEYNLLKNIFEKDNYLNNEKELLNIFNNLKL